MLSDYFQLAFRNLRHRKRRSWLTIIGTLIGIMAVVSLISIGQGLEGSIQSEFERLGGNKVFISPGGGITAQFSGSTVVLDGHDIDTVRNTRGVDHAVGEISGSLPVSYGDETVFLTLRGLPMGEGSELAKTSNNIQIEQGRYLREMDRSNVVIGSRVSTDAFEDEIGLRKSLEVNGTSMRIVGIADRSGGNIDNSVMLPLDPARDLLDKTDGEYDTITAEIVSGFTSQEVKQNLQEELRDLRNVEEGEEDFQIQTSEDIVDSFQSQLQIVRAVLVGIGSISLFVGGVGIMNTMYTSVAQRTREIGIMKAVGASPRQINTLFLVESGMIGLIGGVIGATLGIAVSIGATQLITQQIGFEINAYISPLLVIGSVLFSFVVGMISGVLPARKAAKMQPVEALSYD
jgi:putative ABC transport system permease protein